MIPVRDVALITGLTMRLTRLVVSDDLGQWWVKLPIRAAVVSHLEKHATHPSGQPSDETLATAQGYLDGLDCPHCVSFHAAYLSLGSYLLARRLHLLPAWRFAAGTMSLSAVVGHVSARID